MTNNFSNLSYSITKQLAKDVKKREGIFFTPISTIKTNLNFLEPYFKNINNVLEPSCGSCEYILKLNDLYSRLSITGIEYNKNIYESIKHLETDNIKLLNIDYLNFDENITYDLILGNPPYFVVPKDTVEKDYYKYFDGRPNIFILFIIKSLKLLNKNGILSFILPKNFLKSHYYDKTRKYICNNFKILNIIYCDDDYIETKQETIIMIIQNKNETINNHKYTLNISDYIIFGNSIYIEKIKKLYENSTTLNKLNFKVNVGNIVWNQHKQILTNDNSKTLLIYNSDIKSNQLHIQTYKNQEKKNYINKQGFKEPLLVVNRGYGKGSYKFEYLLIDGTYEYLIENHLICIKYTKPVEKNKLIVMYNNIIKSLQNEKTIEFIKLYFGNNAINTTELCEILPIYNMEN